MKTFLALLLSCLAVLGQNTGGNDFPFMLMGNAIYVSPSGNDSQGKRNSISNPFKTLSSAVSKAQQFDTVIVFPGIYTNNNLLKSNVNWYFYPGATVYWQVATNIGAASNNAWGIFDDRTLNGTPTTNVIGGAGTFIFDGWQGNYGASLLTNGCQTTNQLLYFTALGYASNTIGCFVITNPLTKIVASGHEIRTSYFASIKVTTDGSTQAPGSYLGIGTWAVYIKNCTNASFTFDNVGNSPNIYTNNAIIMDTDGIGDYLLTTYPLSGNNGLYWSHGETYFQVNNIEAMATTQSYGLWTDDGGNNQVVTNNGPVEHCWCNFNSMKSYFYDDSLNTNSRVWITAKDIEPLIFGTGGVVCFGSGKVYVDALKITGATNLINSFPINLNGPAPALSPAGTVWIRCQKVTSTGAQSWATIVNENCYLDVQQWEDQNNTVTTGIGAGGGGTNLTCFIRGQSAVMTAGGTFLTLNTITNRFTLEGLTVDTSASGSTNAPILLRSNMVTGSNLFLQNMTFVLPPFTTNGLCFATNANMRVNIDAINWNTTNFGGPNNVVLPFTNISHYP